MPLLPPGVSLGEELGASAGRTPGANLRPWDAQSCEPRGKAVDHTALAKNIHAHAGDVSGGVARLASGKPTTVAEEFPEGTHLDLV